MQEKLENILFNFSREKYFVFGSYVPNLFCDIQSVNRAKTFLIHLFYCHFPCVFLRLLWTKDWSEMKMTRLWVGHFKTIAGHFFANYINSFHKIEVILKCPTYSNLNWIKCYDTNHIFWLPVFCNFVRKKLKIYDS